MTTGRGARPQSNIVSHYQGESGRPVLTFPKRERLSPHAGMRTSLEGTQARREAESHGQDAHVAAVNYGAPVHGASESPWERRRPPGGERCGGAPISRAR